MVWVLDFMTAACACAAALHASGLEVWYVVYKYSMRMNMHMNMCMNLLRTHVHFAAACRCCAVPQPAYVLQRKAGAVFVVAYALLARQAPLRVNGCWVTLNPLTCSAAAVLQRCVLLLRGSDKQV